MTEEKELQGITPPISLPDVTLVIIETGIKALTESALKDTLKQISPKEVIVLTDIDSVFSLVYDGTTKFIPPLRSIEDYNKHLWYTVPPLISTSHFLLAQWDGWVINPKAWTEDFLSYDYIGAVWPWHREYRVGNGGFSLRSTKLMREMSRLNGEPILIPGSHEDDNLCRVYRKILEQIGYRWAPEPLANQFSREHYWPSSTRDIHLNYQTPFGFHDVRNWPRVLSCDSLLSRLSLCELYPYTRNKPEYQQLKEMLK